jgi:hypothetical protein
MKLLIQGDRIAGTATDAYTGPMEFMPSPEGFDIDRMGEYTVIDGVPTLPSVDVQQVIVDATQKRLDDFARTRNYDGILSLCTYATSTVHKFQTEGQYGVNARDATWATLYTILEEVLEGIRPPPTGYADVEPLLPVLEWPA